MPMTKTEALTSIAQAILRSEGADETRPTPCRIANAVNRADSITWGGEELREAAFNELVRQFDATAQRQD